MELSQQTHRLRPRGAAMRCSFDRGRFPATRTDAVQMMALLVLLVLSQSETAGPPSHAGGFGVFGLFSF